LKHKN